MTKYLGVLALAVALAGCANNGSDMAGKNTNRDPMMENHARGPGLIGSADQAFVQDAAAGGMYEVDAANIASNKGTSQHVKMVAQHMITDHNKANDQLLKIAKEKGVA